MPDFVVDLAPVFLLIFGTYFLIWRFVLWPLVRILFSGLRVGAESLDRHDKRNVAAGRYEPDRQDTQAGTDFIMLNDPVYRDAPRAYYDAVQPAHNVREPMYRPSVAGKGKR